MARTLHNRFSYRGVNYCQKKSISVNQFNISWPEKKVSRLPGINIIIIIIIWGARDGAEVRALASHQCGAGSNPGVDAICGLSLLLVLSFAPRGFSPGTPVFPSPQKKFNISKFHFDQESDPVIPFNLEPGRRRTTLWMCYLKNHYYYYYYYY